MHGLTLSLVVILRPQMYSNLQAIRFDLERVRLMLDVVRKREKIKVAILTCRFTFAFFPLELLYRDF